MRLNFSHGSYEFHGGLIANLRKTFETNPGQPVAIALDTKGPEIRTGIYIYIYIYTYTYTCTITYIYIYIYISILHFKKLEFFSNSSYQLSMDL